MLLKRVGRLSQVEHHTLQNNCWLALGAAGEEDISSYAPGRQRAWLFGEPDLRKDIVAVKPAFESEYFRELLHAIAPTASVGLVALGIIKPHRDHRYSSGKTWGITTKRCVFEIWPRETDLRDCKRGTGELHELEAGDISFFDSKHPHCVWEHELNRFSVTFWEIRPEWKQLMSKS